MGNRGNYGLSLFNEFEKLNAKFDKLIIENKNLSLTIYSLKSEIKSLTKELEEAHEVIKKLQEDNDRLKNQINKNSTNSSKPSSTNITTPKKKTGANLYNYRTKTDKKIGGQFGHIGHNLSKKQVEDLINTKKIEVRTITHTIKGKSAKTNTIKYKLGIEIKPYVEEHVFIYSEEAKETLPIEFYSDVTYDNSIKALSLELGAYNVISYDRLSDFFNVITDGILNISNGTLVNFLREFSIKSKAVLII